MLPLAFFQYILAKKAADKKSAAFCLHVFAKPVPEKIRGQVLAALSTAAGQHLTAVLRSHALQKAMNAAALTLLRLEVCFISYSLLQSFPNTGHFLAIYAWQMPVDTGAALQTLIIAQGRQVCQ